MTTLNDLLNAIMSLQLPFALIPTIAFTSNPRLMGKFANGMYVFSVLVPGDQIIIMQSEKSKCKWKSKVLLFFHTARLKLLFDHPV